MKNILTLLAVMITSLPGKVVTYELTVSETGPVQTSAPIVKTTLKELTPKPSASPAKQTIKPYPLDICLVTDEPLDEWDEMQQTVYQNQEMKFCCKMCLKKFNANPDKYLALLPQA